jgi:hypothetical protein
MRLDTARCAKYLPADNMPPGTEYFALSDIIAEKPEKRCPYVGWWATFGAILFHHKCSSGGC